MEILRYITDNHPVTVREVAEHLAETKGQTRTTAHNMMERLREKGYLVRRKIAGIYAYSPSRPKPQLLRDLIRDFVDRVLGGSVEPFVAYLIQEAEVSEEQLAELRRLVEEAAAERPHEEQP